ncbi:MAG: AMIN domain-containing protein, partial [Myxococcota bacterium]
MSLSFAFAMALAGWGRADERPLRRVQAVKLLPVDEGGSEVFIRTDGEPQYSARVVQGGRRLLIDLPRARVGTAQDAITDFVGVVGGV